MLHDLEIHYSELTSQPLLDLFTQDPNRYNNYSLSAAHLHLDYSKNWITTETIMLFEKHLQSIDFHTRREQMFTGKKINFTENRAVLHTALRNSTDASIYAHGEDVMPLINAELKKVEAFCQLVHSGEFSGYSDKHIKHVVNIGIGGSDLGPYMVTEALKPFHSPKLPQVHFVSNVDGAHLTDTLQNIDIERTLFLIASKTFTTQETMANAHVAKAAVLDHYNGDADSVSSHFAALSTNVTAVSEFGIDPQYMFRFWDWVGGRYSLWSAIGLSIALYLGMDNFKELLAGAEDMDNHFRTAPESENMPILLAILGVGYNNFMGFNSHAVLPYAQHLHRFPAFLQQLDMESNGKGITKDGDVINTPTGPLIWGEPGTNGQHAFYQLLHQGTQKIPCDLIAVVNPQHALDEHHSILLANCIAQSQALLKGRSRTEVDAELRQQGLGEDEITQLAPHKVFTGNRPSNTIILNELTPRSLGSLIALYEHKIFTQGVIWNINSFDQYGVELGKVLAKDVLNEITKDESDSGNSLFDSSTGGLISYLKTNRR